MSAPVLEITWTDPVTGRKGYVVLDTLVRGLASGGLRVREGCTLEEVRGLARGMTRKEALVYDPADTYLPLGGDLVDGLLAQAEVLAGVPLAPHDRQDRGEEPAQHVDRPGVGRVEVDAALAAAQRQVGVGRVVDEGFLAGHPTGEAADLLERAPLPDAEAPAGQPPDQGVEHDEPLPAVTGSVQVISSSGALIGRLLRRQQVGQGRDGGG